MKAKFKLDVPTMIGPGQFWQGQQTWLIINRDEQQGVDLSMQWATEDWIIEAKRKGWLE